MEADSYQLLPRTQLGQDYWEMAEVALLLRLVSLVVIGGAVAVCLWLAVLALGDVGRGPFVGSDPAQAKSGCKCELLLVPMPPRSRQIVDARAPIRT